MTTRNRTLRAIRTRLLTAERQSEKAFKALDHARRDAWAKLQEFALNEQDFHAWCRAMFGDEDLPALGDGDVPAFRITRASATWPNSTEIGKHNDAPQPSAAPVEDEPELIDLRAAKLEEFRAADNAMSDAVIVDAMAGDNFDPTDPSVSSETLLRRGGIRTMSFESPARDESEADDDE